MEQKEELQKTDASEMQTVMPETERTEAEINEPVERLPKPKQPEMTKNGIKISRDSIRFTMNWNSRIMQFTEEKQRFAKKKNCLRSKAGLKEERKRIAEKNRRSDKPDQGT